VALGLPGGSFKNTGHWAAQNIELLTHALSGITTILHWTESQNTGQSG